MTLSTLLLVVLLGSGTLFAQQPTPPPSLEAADMSLSIEELRRRCESEVRQARALLEREIEGQLQILRNNPPGSEISQRAKKTLARMGRAACETLVGEIATGTADRTLLLSCASILASLLDDPENVSWQQGAISRLAGLLGTGTPSQQVAVLVALQSTGDPALVPDLIAILDSNDFEARRWAARILGHLKSPEAIPGLEKLLQDQDYRVRQLGVETLALIDTEAQGVRLLDCLSDPSNEVKRAVYVALGRSRDTRVVEALRTRLRTLQGGLDSVNPDPIVIRELEWILKALGDIGSPAVIDDLRQVLRTTTLPAISQATEASLLAILIAVRTSGARQALGDVRQLLDSSWSDLQREAIRVVRDLRDTEALDRLHALLDNTDQDTVLLVIRTLGQIADPSSRTRLRALLRPTSSRIVVVESAYALARMGDFAGVDEVTAPIRQRLLKERNNAFAMVDMADAYKELTKYSDAIGWYRKALKSGRIASRARVKYSLAACYSLSGQIPAARAYLQQAMAEGFREKDPQTDPDFAGLRQAVGALIPETGYGGK